MSKQGNQENSRLDSLRKMLASKCRSNAEFIRENNEVLGFHEFLEGVYAQRRQKAILNYMDKAVQEFKDIQAVEETFADWELIPVPSYNDLDADSGITLAAALWILEKLRSSGKMAQAYQFLPDPYEEPEEFWDMPADFSHVCFSNDLIRSVMVLLRDRYVDRPEILCEDAACGREPDENYRRLMELLPEEDVERACEAFRTSLWDMETHCMNAMNCLIAKYAGLTAHIMNLSRDLEALDKSCRKNDLPGNPALDSARDSIYGELDGLIQQKKEVEDIRNDITFNPGKYLRMSPRAVRRATKSMEVAEALAGFYLEDPYEICFALFCLIDHNDDAPWLLHAGRDLVSYAMEMLPWVNDLYAVVDSEPDEYSDGMEYNGNGWLERDPVEDDVDLYHTMHGGRNLAQVIYRFCRTVLPKGQHPFEDERRQLIAEGMDENLARRIIDSSELFFLRSFQLEHHDEVLSYSQYKDEMEESHGFSSYGPGCRDSDEANGAGGSDCADGKDSRQDAPVSLIGYWADVARGLGMEVVPPVSLADEVKTSPEAVSAKADVPSAKVAEAETIEDVRKQLSLVRKQLKEVKSALAITRQDSASERARYELELKSLRMEHRELSDLRELVFNLENEVEQAPVKQIQYPYRTRKRTVVFGGHEDFLRNIRPMLPEVKFVDADALNFNTDIIRYADVVWIQSNCISHSQFNIIARQCRTSGIQMRYFSYSSAGKCAEQLVTEDQK